MDFASTCQGSPVDAGNAPTQEIISSIFIFMTFFCWGLSRSSFGY